MNVSNDTRAGARWRSSLLRGTTMVLCAAAVALGGCERTAASAPASQAASSGYSPQEAIPVSNQGSVINLSSPRGDEFAVVSYTGDLVLHVACDEGQTKIILVADHFLSSDNEVEVDEKFGDNNIPPSPREWLTTTDQKSLIFDGGSANPRFAAMVYLILIVSRPSYWVEVRPSGSPVFDARFDTTSLRNVLRSHGAACDWATLPAD